MHEQSYKILLIDDEENFRFMTRMSLEEQNYQVVEAADGKSGLQLIDQEHPDLILLDLNMPEPDGHQVCEDIKNNPRWRSIPVIILTASDDLTDKLRRLEGGADDYVTKYMDFKELEVRIRSAIRKNLHNLDSNPLTRLPGNNVIQDTIQKKFNALEKFSCAYYDLDNFKAFNDKYGFSAGDDVIKFTADIIQQATQQKGAGDEFVGHIGGDDFVVIGSPEKVKDICHQSVALLDEGIKKFYNDEDREKGFIITRDRQGAVQQFPFVSVSIAVASNIMRDFENIGEILKIITELKKFAKQKKGSCVVFDKRTD